jgi:hypothetical protein
MFSEIILARPRILLSGFKQALVLLCSFSYELRFKRLCSLVAFCGAAMTGAMLSSHNVSRI